MAILGVIPKANYKTPEEADPGLFFYALDPDELIVPMAMVHQQTVAVDTAAALRNSLLNDSRKHVMSFRIRYALHRIGRYLENKADEMAVKIAPDVLRPGSRLQALYDEFGNEADGQHRLTIPRESIGRISLNPLWDRADRHGLIIGSTPVADVRVITEADKETPLHLAEGTLPSQGRWSRFPLADIEFYPTET